MRTSSVIAAHVLLSGCTPAEVDGDPADPISPALIEPVFVTPAVRGDADDPAIWLDPTSLEDSLLLGTDKAEDGAVHVWDLEGRGLESLARRGLQTPNNVTIESGFVLGGTPIDIAVVTEREAEQLRVYRMPDMEPIDGGGLQVFAGESGAEEEPVGVGLYTRPSDGRLFAHVSRADGPTTGYLHTYELHDDGTGTVVATFVAAFGAFSGTKDIESVVVDDELGVLYYCDERFAVRKYAADPDHPTFGTEITRFAENDYTDAREGVALLRNPDGTGYVLVSDQDGNRVHVYPREGFGDDPNAHPRLGTFATTAVQTDGMDVTAANLGGAFASGLFVQHSDEGSFHVFALDTILAGVEWVDRDGSSGG